MQTPSMMNTDSFIKDQKLVLRGAQKVWFFNDEGGMHRYAPTVTELILFITVDFVSIREISCTNIIP